MTQDNNPALIVFSAILDVFKEVTFRYEDNIQTVKRIEDELLDIRHEVELSSPKDMYNAWKVYNQLRELLRERRRAKNENELLKNLYSFLRTEQAQTFKKKIAQLQDEMKATYNKQSSRTYKPRQRDDLSITGHTCETKPTFEDLMEKFNQTKVRMEKGKYRK